MNHIRLGLSRFLRCDNFLYGFKGAPRRAGPFPALADSEQDRDALREFVGRRKVGRQELRGGWRGCSADSGGGGLPATYGR